MSIFVIKLFGICAFIVMALSYQMKGKKGLLFLQFISYTLLLIESVLLGSFIMVAVFGINIVRAIACFAEESKEEKKMNIFGIFDGYGGKEVLKKPFNKKSSTLRTILSEIMKIKYPEIIVKSDVAVVNLEHVVPKTVTEEWKAESGEDIEDYVYHIGNLTLMSSPINSSMKNATFKQKKEIYKSSGIPLTTEIGNSKINVWNKEVIINRTEELVNLFIERWGI